MKKKDLKDYKWEFVKYNKAGNRVIPIMRGGVVEKTFTMRVQKDND